MKRFVFPHSLSLTNRSPHICSSSTVCPCLLCVSSVPHQEIISLLYIHPQTTQAGSPSLWLNSFHGNLSDGISTNTPVVRLIIQDEGKKSMDPFYESQENHNLIGVANVFLEVLFHDVKLDYHTPIISQQGEVAGRLQVEITRIAGQMPQDRMCETSSENSHDSREDDFNTDPASNQVVISAVQSHRESKQL